MVNIRRVQLLVFYTICGVQSSNNLTLTYTSKDLSQVKYIWSMTE